MKNPTTVLSKKSIKIMEKIKSTLIYYSKRRLFKYGLPFLVLVVGGSIGLKEFSQIR